LGETPTPGARVKEKKFQGIKDSYFELLRKLSRVSQIQFAFVDIPLELLL
jgi:hypothetical protein